MSGSKFFRLIETYFEGSILPHEKVLLEQQILKDPLLKAEFELQQNIVSGIKQNRKLQLKQKLSAIETPAVTITAGYLSAVKWLAATITAATIFGGILYWSIGNNSPIMPLDLKVTDRLTFDTSLNVIIPTPSKTVNAISINLPENYASVERKETKKVSVTSQDKALTQTALLNSEINSIKNAEIKPQSLLSFEDERLFEGNSNENIKSLSPVAIAVQSRQNSEIELQHAKVEHKYHYQYLDNKLYLYGNFDEEPYEIIELKNLGDKKLYLSYKDAIYLIDTDVKEISELQKITDPKLKQDLFLIIDSK